MRRQHTLDERQIGVRDRAWRRTCILVLAAVWVNSTVGPWQSRWDQAFGLLGLAIVAMTVQEVWGGAYFGLTEPSRFSYFALALGVVFLGGLYVKEALAAGSLTGGAAGGVLILLVMNAAVPLSAGARWLFDRAASRVRGGG